MQKSKLITDSYTFALEIVRESIKIQQEQREYILSKQIIRSGTSIGANINKAFGAFSRKEFSHKLSLSYRESLETQYWLKLLGDLNFIEGTKVDSMLSQCISLTMMLRKAINTTSNSVE